MDKKLIPNGWHQLLFGEATAGDKYWDPARAAWLPITVGSPESGKKVLDFSAVIRKGDR